MCNLPESGTQYFWKSGPSLTAETGFQVLGGTNFILSADFSQAVT